jgi:tetratricopeptide (TPR) repeat protein
MLKVQAGSLILSLMFGLAWAREHEPTTAKVLVGTGMAGCQVDLDSAPAGTTDAAGNLTLGDVDPGDHYLHVRCPGKVETTHFISPKAKEVIKPNEPADAAAAAADEDPVALAEKRTQLPHLVQQAVQLRQQARLEDAVAMLRQAANLDPNNSDLHRELGITFLLAKDWKRARVEMLEALRNDRTDADAHNGLGYALEKLGDINDALKEYHNAMNLEPDDPTYRTHYFDALVKVQTQQQTKK